MRDAGLESVDLRIGASAAVAKPVLALLRPKAYLPVHWDGYPVPSKPVCLVPRRTRRPNRCSTSTASRCASLAVYG
jgi:hypothetical protein